MAFDVAIKFSAQGQQQVQQGLQGVDKALAGVSQSGQQAGQSLEGVEQRLDRMNGSLSKVAHYGAGLFLLIPALQSLGAGFLTAADAVTTLRNRLDLATGGGARAAAAFEDLYSAAQRSRTSFTELGSVYATLARAGYQNVAVVEAIGNAMAISGGSAQGMQAALVQLGQGLSSGVLRGEELNSVMEQAPRLAQALADGLGVPIGALRRMGEQGELTSKQVVDALMKSAPQLAEEVKKSTVTVSQGFTVLGNSMTKFVGEVDAATGFSKALANALRDIGGGLDSLSRFIKENQTVLGILAATFGAAAVTAAAMYATTLAVGVVGAIAKVGVAFAALSVAAAANPIGLALLGIGAVAGGAMYAANRFSESETGIRNRIKQLEGPASIYDSPEMRDPAKRAAELETLRQSLVSLEVAGHNVTAGTKARTAASREVALAAQQEEQAVKAARDRVLEASGVNVKHNATVLQMRDDYLAGRISLEDYTRAVAQVTGAAKVSQQELRRAAEAAKDAAKDAAAEELRIVTAVAAARNQARQAEEQGIQAYFKAQGERSAYAQDMLRDIETETAMLSLSNTEREIAVALLALEANGIGKATQEYRDYADQLRKAIEARAGKRNEIDAAKNAADEWKRASDDIERSLTDALMRGFESGRGFMDSLVSSLKSAFKTMVLQPTIRAIMQPVAGSLTSMMGLPGSAAAGQGAGGGGASSLLSNLGSIGTLLGTAGTTLGTGFAAGMAGTLGGAGAATFGAGASLAGAGIGAGSAVGAAGGVGLMAGAAIPYVAAALALYAAYQSLKHKPTPHMGSVVGVGADGAASTMYGDPSQITNNYHAETDAALRGLGGASTGSLNALSQAFGGAGGFSSVAKFAADGKDASIGQFFVSRNGQRVGTGVQRDNGNYALYSSDRETAFKAYTADVAKATREALDSVGLPQWARDQFAALGSDSTIEQFAALADSVAQFQTGLRTMQGAVAQIGGVFGRVAGLGGDALKQLTDFAGGIEAFTQQALGFVQEYYGRDEIAALKAREIQGVLQGAGITGDVNSREQFRSIVEGLDVGTEAGRKQLATLLGISGSFAGVADYLAETGSTLGEVAANAPAMGSLGPLISTGSQQVAATVEVRDAIQALHETTRELVSIVAGPGSGGWRGGGSTNELQVAQP